MFPFDIWANILTFVSLQELSILQRVSWLLRYAVEVELAPGQRAKIGFQSGKAAVYWTVAELLKLRKSLWPDNVKRDRCSAFRYTQKRGESLRFGTDPQ
jgi:hypothetical protein